MSQPDVASPVDYMEDSAPFPEGEGSSAPTPSTLPNGNPGLVQRKFLHAVPRTTSLGKLPTAFTSANSDPPAAAAQNTNELAVAEAMRKLREEERAKREAKKRKRDEEENWSRQVKSRLTEESNRVEKELQQSHEANRELYALFNDLQGISHDFGLNFDTPELVVVGMQSDGKSSFIEALLGFQFNIVETNLGTRRPLILQMINSPERDTPRCRFRKEQQTSAIVDDLGDLEDQTFEPHDTPIDDLVEEILHRTNEKAGKGEGVSNVPIILRVEYAHCSNLTIYDTPGFRLGGKEGLRREIQQMVEKLMAPSNRIIICLEQSTVEWANTTSRPIVQKYDPEFARTVLINTKFDNRAKELRHSEAANKYLMGENLPPGKKPFFISLPVRRDLEGDRFREAIKEAYLDDYEKLLRIRFDEESFVDQIGFFRAKSHMEQLLTKKYYESLAPTLRTLDNVCKETERELHLVRKELESNNVELQKSKANRYIQSFILLIERLLEGSIIGDPDRFGETLAEEKSASGVGDWPMLPISYDIQNAEYKIYGGAQYERLINEFEYVAHSKEFPHISINEVAAAIGTSKYHNVPIYETAASDIVQIKARTELQPLIEIILARCTYIMKRLFIISIAVLKTTEQGVMNSYEPFMKELKRVYTQFIEATETECRAKLMDDFETFTKIMDWDLIAGFSSIKDYNYLDHDVSATKERVETIMSKEPRDTFYEGNRSRKVDNEIYSRVCRMSAKLFAGIRFFFVKYVRNKLNSFFLDPVFQKLGAEVTDHFRRLTNEEYEELFALGAAELRERLQVLEKQLAHCTASRDRFKEAYLRLIQTQRK